MKERRERTMADLQADAASAVDPLDYVVAERFRAERHPDRSVDGDDPYERNLFGCACGQPGCDECDPDGEW